MGSLLFSGHQPQVNLETCEVIAPANYDNRWPGYPKSPGDDGYDATKIGTNIIFPNPKDGYDTY